MRRFTIFSLGSLGIFMAACNLPEERAAKPASSISATETPTSEPSKDSGVGSLALELPTDPKGIFSYVDAGMNSALDGGDSNSNAVALLTPGTLAISALTLSGESGGGGGSGEEPILGVLTQYCNQLGEPMSSDSSRNHASTTSGVAAAMTRADADYAAGKMFCLLDYPAESPDTAPGSLAIFKMFACLTDGKVVYDGQPHEVAVTLSHNDCLLPSLRAQIDAAPETVTSALTVTATKPPAFGLPSWDYSLQIDSQGDNGIETYKMLFKSSGNAVAIAGSMAPQGYTSAVDGFSIYLNPETGSLNYEGKFQRQILVNNPYIRHLRLMATGTVGASGAFSVLDTFSGIYSNLGVQTGGEFRINDLFTVQGNTTKGFRSFGYLCDSGCGDLTDLAKWVQVGNSNDCYGGDHTCAGVSGIQLATTADLAFLLNPNLTPTPAASDVWFASSGPLTFTELKMLESQ